MFDELDLKEYLYDVWLPQQLTKRSKTNSQHISADQLREAARRANWERERLVYADEIEKLAITKSIEAVTQYKDTLLSAVQTYPDHDDWSRGRKQGIMDCIADQDERITELRNQLGGKDE